MMKKWWILLLCAVCLCSCRVKSEQQIVRYAQQQFGACELLSEEEVSAGRKCTFRDKEYGFTYYVASEMDKILIDGSDFGSVEDTKSDFGTQYKQEMYKHCRTALDNVISEYHAQRDDGDSFDFINVTCEANDARTIAEKLSAIIADFDSRQYFKDSHLGFYDRQGKRLGRYQIHQQKWVDADDEYDEFYINEGKSLNRKAVYLRKEKKRFADTGLDPSEVNVYIGEEPYTNDTPVQYYYFSVEGKEFFIADFALKGEYGHYTNYDRS